MKTSITAVIVSSLISLIFLILIATTGLFASDTEPRLQKATELLESNKLSEAREILESYVKTDSRDPEAWFLLGKIALRENRANDAGDYLKKAIRLDENKPEYHHFLGRAYGMQAMNAGVLRQPFLARNSRRSFETAVDLDPDNIEARFDLMQFYLIAPGIVGGGMDKAVDQAEVIKKRDPVRGHGAFGFIYNRQNEPEKAEREFIAAKEIDASNPDPYTWLVFLYTRTGRYEYAFNELETLIELRPDHMYAYYMYGSVAAQSGERLETGRKYLEKYLSHTPGMNEPSHAATHLRLGNIYKHENDIPRAREQYEKALELDPEYRQAKEALSNL